LVLGELGKAVLMLFIVLDPLTAAPYYAVEASRIPSEAERRAFLNRVIAAAFLMLVSFAIAGDYIFELLNVSINDFRIAAGIILLIYAVASLFDVRIGGSREEARASIVPIAVPLLAGPGSISVLLYIKYAYGPHIALSSAAINIALTYPIFYYSGRIVGLLGDYGISFIDKFMSLLMAGFAVSIIREGLTRL
jgi:multiple antibiotic resistance protein